MRHFFVMTLACLVIAVSAVGAMADNQTEAEYIADRLCEQFPNDEITVQYQDGCVWLSGQVTNNLQMLKMIQFVSTLDSVKTVENELTLLERPVATAALNSNQMVQTNEIVQSAMNAPVQQPYAGQYVQAAPQPSARQTLPPIQRTVVTTNEPEVINQVGLHHARGARSLQGTYDEYASTTHVGSQVPLAMGAEQVYVGHGPSDYMSSGYQGVYGSTAGGSCPNLPSYAWPSYAAHPNYAQVTYPKYYRAKAWPNIGPFYPYPHPPLGWRKVTMEWHDGKWWMDFDDGSAKGPFSPLFREQPIYRY